MTSFRFSTSVVGYVTTAFFAGTVWLTHLRQPTVLGEGIEGSKSGVKQNQRQPIAVIELFTSQGCSSCPPADENLQRIASTAARLDQKVFPLSFHVDYWNRLGWKDPFSQAAFSKRQREYSLILDSDTYTPQMIVNGASQFVGSDRRLTDRAIRKALESPAKHAVTLAAGATGDQQRLSFRYQVAGPLSMAGEAAD